MSLASRRGRCGRCPRLVRCVCSGGVVEVQVGARSAVRWLLGTLPRIWREEGDGVGGAAAKRGEGVARSVGEVAVDAEQGGWCWSSSRAARPRKPPRRAGLLTFGVRRVGGFGANERAMPGALRSELCARVRRAIDGVFLSPKATESRESDFHCRQFCRAMDLKQPVVTSRRPLRDSAGRGGR
jgi:hypothetical protein